MLFTCASALVVTNCELGRPQVATSASMDIRGPPGGQRRGAPVFGEDVGFVSVVARVYEEFRLWTFAFFFLVSRFVYISVITAVYFWCVFVAAIAVFVGAFVCADLVFG